MTNFEQLIQVIKTKNKIKKIIIGGSGAVGKTTLLSLLINENEDISLADADTIKNYKRTPFMNIEASSIVDEDNNVVSRLQFYDLAGQLNLPIHALKDFTKNVLGKTDFVFFVFANDNLQTLLDLEKWIKLIDQGAENDTQIKFLLIKNKVDQPSVIDDSLVQDLLKMEKRFLQYFQLSCLTRDGINDLYEWIRSET